MPMIFCGVRWTSLRNSPTFEAWTKFRCINAWTYLPNWIELGALGQPDWLIFNPLSWTRWKCFIDWSRHLSTKDATNISKLNWQTMNGWKPSLSWILVKAHGKSRSTGKVCFCVKIEDSQTNNQEWKFVYNFKYCVEKENTWKSEGSESARSE